MLQAHIEAVHADWKEYLNLLICEESHLKFMEEFHKVPDPWGQRGAVVCSAQPGEEVLGCRRSQNTNKLLLLWEQGRRD